MAERSSPAAPKYWPSALKYIDKPLFSKGLTKEVQATLNFPTTSSGDPSPVRVPRNQIPKSPSPLVKIVPISDKSHPACKQFGLFASKTLGPDSLIMFYLGWVHTWAESDLSSDYDLSLDREAGVGVDASKVGNEARFINDYRGIASGPNAEFKDTWIATATGGYERRMGVFVLSAGKSGKRSKGIVKGEEILVSYGKGFWKERVLNDGNETGTQNSANDNHDRTVT
jgi:hypothetical protein